MLQFVLGSLTVVAFVPPVPTPIIDTTKDFCTFCGIYYYNSKGRMGSQCCFTSEPTAPNQHQYKRSEPARRNEGTGEWRFFIMLCVWPTTGRFKTGLWQFTANSTKRNATENVCKLRRQCKVQEVREEDEINRHITGTALPCYDIALFRKQSLSHM